MDKIVDALPSESVQVLDWGTFFQNLSQNLFNFFTGPTVSIGLVIVVAVIIIGLLIMRR